MRFLALAMTLLPMSLAAPLELKRAGESLPNPTVDPFYKVPSNIATYSAGQIVDKRDVTTNIEGTNVASSYQVSYRSLTTKQDADMTVATIWVPKKIATPTKIFSYQAYEDSTTLDCNPSWAFVKDSDSNNKFVTSLDTPIYINYALSKGWYVVAADHEGSQSAFISGRQQGQAVLDGVRALINSESLAKDSQVGLLGYSGGASATVWAENLHSSYAPELNVVAGVHGGTPIDSESGSKKMARGQEEVETASREGRRKGFVEEPEMELRSISFTDLLETLHRSALNTFNFLNKSFFAGFAGAGIVGLNNAYPELSAYIQSITTPAGKAALAKYAGSGYCLANVATGDPFTDFLKYFTVDNALAQPIPAAVLKNETLLIERATTPDLVSTPKFPRFMFHGLEDGIISYKDARAYAQQQCAAGANIAFTTLPVAEHILGEILGLVPEAFAGKAPSVKCGTSLPQIPLRSQQAKDIIGQDAVNSLLSMNGQKDVLGNVLHF